MTMLAKTDASGGTGLLPEVLAFTSSLELDRQLLREDLVGSLAHLIMLARTGLIPKEDAAAIRAHLLSIAQDADAGTLSLPEEEDVHMAVEAHLTAALGPVAGLLHTGRSRNDQVALDLHLHVRSQIAEGLLALASLIEQLVERARGPEGAYVLPSYTHRQRAQPVSLAYTLASWAAGLARDVQTLTFVLEQADASPLGVGAVGGTSLPIDRELTRTLLGFSRHTLNGMDTVGDRDFALDFAYATAKVLLHAGRISADVIDFASSEFRFVTLDGAIACGSSMMPQKRNPDVFELIRGKGGRATGNLMGLFTVLKGLPGGYNRDLQEDRQLLLETGPLLRNVVHMLGVGLANIHFDPERMEAALQRDYTQATDVAEALALKGVPFRTAYKAAGALVRTLQEAGRPLSDVTLEDARAHHPEFDETVLEAAQVRRSVERKANAGGTGPGSVRAQLEALSEVAAAARRSAAEVPSLSSLFQRLAGEAI